MCFFSEDHSLPLILRVFSPNTPLIVILNEAQQQTQNIFVRIPNRKRLAKILSNDQTKVRATKINIFLLRAFMHFEEKERSSSKANLRAPRMSFLRKKTSTIYAMKPRDYRGGHAPIIAGSMEDFPSNDLSNAERVTIRGR